MGQTVNLSFCTSLAALPAEVGRWQKVQEVDLSDCSSLATFPGEVWALPGRVFLPNGSSRTWAMKLSSLSWYRASAAAAVAALKCGRCRRHELSVVHPESREGTHSSQMMGLLGRFTP